MEVSAHHLGEIARVRECDSNRDTQAEAILQQSKLDCLAWPLHAWGDGLEHIMPLFLRQIGMDLCDVPRRKVPDLDGLEDIGFREKEENGAQGGQGGAGWREHVSSRDSQLLTNGMTTQTMTSCFVQYRAWGAATSRGTLKTTFGDCPSIAPRPVTPSKNPAIVCEAHSVQ